MSTISVQHTGQASFYSCNMGMSDLPEMNAQSPRAHPKANSLNANKSTTTIYARLKGLIMVLQQVTL